VIRVSKHNHQPSEEEKKEDQKNSPILKENNRLKELHCMTHLSMTQVYAVLAYNVMFD